MGISSDIEQTFSKMGQFPNVKFLYLKIELILRCHMADILQILGVLLYKKFTQAWPQPDTSGALVQLQIFSLKCRLYSNEQLPNLNKNLKGNIKIKIPFALNSFSINKIKSCYIVNIYFSRVNYINTD